MHKNSLCARIGRALLMPRTKARVASIERYVGNVALFEAQVREQIEPQWSRSTLFAEGNVDGGV